MGSDLITQLNKIVGESLSNMSDEKRSSVVDETNKLAKICADIFGLDYDDVKITDEFISSIMHNNTGEGTNVEETTNEPKKEPNMKFTSCDQCKCESGSDECSDSCECKSNNCYNRLPCNHVVDDENDKVYISVSTNEDLSTSLVSQPIQNITVKDRLLKELSEFEHDDTSAIDTIVEYVSNIIKNPNGQYKFHPRTSDKPAAVSVIIKDEIIKKENISDITSVLTEVGNKLKDTYGFTNVFISNVNETVNVFMILD